MMQEIQQIVFTKEELETIVADLGHRISQDYQDKNLLLVGILRGAVVVMADLMRVLTIPCQIDFMEVSSYGNCAESSGKVVIRKDLPQSLEGYDVLIVEDILDSGTTLRYIRELLQTRGAASVKLCVLLDKPQSHRVEIGADYVGANAPDGFLVGYGLDYAQQYRNLPFIGILKPEVYTQAT
ncbi:MAG: hypoxanthine phosphoribosyltransferase [Clostridiales bacterium]|jgi:hypoxanthine phosphoribosyltransferase|nr:hypoxanthine phosphoribosyltransferase [Clostridiales bacterium]